MNKFPKEKFSVNYDLGNSASLGYDVRQELSILKIEFKIYI